MKYYLCPSCGKSAHPARLISADYRRHHAIYECPYCATIYALHFAKAGLLLDTKIAARAPEAEDA